LFYVDVKLGLSC